MKKTSFILILTFVIFSVQGENVNQNEFISIDQKALQIPIELTRTTDNIAHYYNAMFSSEIEKLRAIFVWIAANIDYDLENVSMNVNRSKKEDKISQTLQRHKGVCENYAALFVDISMKCGLKSYAIEGYTRQYGKVDVFPHAWCAVFVRNSWYLFDPTWGAGYVEKGRYVRRFNGDYFLVNPKKLIATHIPFDYLWQFLHYPITHQRFFRGDVLEEKSGSIFNFKDSICEFEKQNREVQLSEAIKRLEKNGVVNPMIGERFRYLKLELETLKQNHSVDLFNGAVADFNFGISKFNEFVQFRNQMFVPEKPDSVIRKMINTASLKLAESKTKLDEIRYPTSQMEPKIARMTKSINQCFAEIEEHNKWLSIYFKRGKIERKTMFFDGFNVSYRSL